MRRGQGMTKNEHGFARQETHPCGPQVSAKSVRRDFLALPSCSCGELGFDLLADIPLKKFKGSSQ